MCIRDSTHTHTHTHTHTNTGCLKKWYKLCGTDQYIFHLFLTKTAFIQQQFNNVTTATTRLKVKVRFICIAPKLPQTPPQPAYSMGRSPSPRSRTLYVALQPHVALVCRLMVFTSVIHVITWITTHLMTPEGWKAKLAQSADPQQILYPQSGHLSTIDQHRSGKVAKADILTTELRFPTIPKGDDNLQVQQWRMTISKLDRKTNLI